MLRKSFTAIDQSRIKSHGFTIWRQKPSLIPVKNEARKLQGQNKKTANKSIKEIKGWIADKGDLAYTRYPSLLVGK